MTGYAGDIDHHTNVATQHIGYAQSALNGLLRNPEPGFAIDPRELEAELVKAMELLLLVRRMVAAAKGTPEPAPPAPVCSRQHRIPVEAVARVQVLSGGVVKIDGLVCPGHLEMEQRAGEIGMAEVKVLPLPGEAATDG